jgi:4'-phosphopantetheinyl transferase
VLSPLLLRPCTVHVWQAAADQIPPGALDLLDADERARADRFRRPADCARFAASHAALRRVLARYTDAEPAALRFETLSQGKPVLVREAGAPDLRFSLSHSGRFALVAVGRGQEVGVDIEAERPLPDLLRLAERVASADERGLLARLDEPERSRAFFRLWVAKEAVLKAQGTGLHADPRRLPLRRLDTDHPEPDESSLRGTWALRMLDAPSGYRAALAAEAPLRQIARYLLPSVA